MRANHWSVLLSVACLTTYAAAGCRGDQEVPTGQGGAGGEGGASGGNGGTSSSGSGPAGGAGNGGEAGSGPLTPINIQPDGWDDDLRATAAIDDSPEAHVFETTFVARADNLELVAGKLTDVWTFNGGVPGPEIRVEVGDRVIVHLKNELPDPTTIHWHGIRLPNNMDGVPDSTQPPVEPGETFTYDFIVPDAGTFWYHPHVDSTVQVGFGLYGALVVTDPSEPPDIGDDVTLLLSDMSIDPDGSSADPTLGGSVAKLFGNEGNVLLVNGKVNPTLQARAGRRQRWRIINATRSRYYELALTGHTFTRFAGDGGLIEHSVESPTLVLSPGERAEVAVAIEGTPGAEIPLRAIPHDRGPGSVFGRQEETLFTLQLAAVAPYQDRPLGTLAREIETLDLRDAQELNLALTQNNASDGSFALGINGVPSWEAEPFMASVGETQIWNITNAVDMSHPFHLHGFFFQVLEENGVAPEVREWKDTTNIKMGGSLRLAVRFEGRPGMWMFHCHILDHSDAGMMGMVHVH